MDFKRSRILIAGLGLIGGSAAKALKNNGFDSMYAYDRDEKTIADAKSDGVIKDGFCDFKDNTVEYDFILCCLSPIFVAPLYKSASPYLKDGGVFAEVGGIKTVMINELETLMDDRHELLSLHPMAGSEKKGYINSSADMFSGSVLVVTPGKNTKENAWLWAEMLKNTLNFKETLQLDAEKHDKIIAKVSHIPHVVALAVKAMNNGTDNEAFAGGSYRSATRVAQINSALWAGLMNDNKDNLVKSIDELEEQLKILKAAIAKGDPESLEKLLNEMSGQE